jgi:hypothetical protein
MKIEHQPNDKNVGNDWSLGWTERVMSSPFESKGRQGNSLLNFDRFPANTHLPADQGFDQSPRKGQVRFY